jgi:uncharacterized membrane protein
VVWVVFMIISWVLPSGISCGVGVIQCVIWIGILVLHVYCIIQAVGGKRPNIPVVTDFAEKSL